MSRDHERVRAIAARCAPGMVFADDARRVRPGARRRQPTPSARRSLPAATARRAAPRRPRGDQPERRRRATRSRPSARTRSRRSCSRRGRPARRRASSTPTGCCAPTSRRSAQVWPFLGAEPPVLVDWLPWSHTFGGNHNLGQVLALRRHAAHRRRQAGARAVRAHGRGAARDRARPSTSTSPPATRCSRRASRPTARWPRRSSRGCGSCSTRRRRCRRALWDRLRALAAERRGPRGPADRARGARPRPRRRATTRALRVGAVRVHRRPAAGRDAQARARRRQLRAPRHAARTSPPATTATPSATAAAFDEEGFYRSGDAARLRRPRRPRPGPALRRPPGRELQAR